LIKFLIGCVGYAFLGAILDSVGIDWHSWKFYAVLGIVFLLEVNEGYFTKKKTIKNCVKIVERER
jgi:hypothetical protein